VRRTRHGSGEDEEAEVNLTPLLDIVFIMLIFFIVTASFTPDAGVDVERPTARSAEPQPGHTLVVAVSADGALRVDGRPVDRRGLRARVAELRAERPNAGVLITADRDVPTGRLVAVMDQVRLAGVEAVAIATRDALP
jgi:biopolymer transport protein ExbD